MLCRGLTLPLRVLILVVNVYLSSFFSIFFFFKGKRILATLLPKLIKLVNSPLFLFRLVSFFFFLFHVFWQYQVGVGITNTEFYKLCKYTYIKPINFVRDRGKNLDPKRCSQKRDEASTPSLFRIMCAVVTYFLLQKIRKKKEYIRYILE